MPLPKNKKNDQYQRLARRRQVATMYVHGATQWEIARKVQCSQGTVCNDLAAIRKDWLDSALRDFDAKKAEELAKLDALEAESWRAWERSCRDAEIRHKRTEAAYAPPMKPGKGKSKANEKARLVIVRRIIQETRKGQAGDTRFLERVAWCIECRLKLMGMLKGEKKVQVVNGIPWEALAAIPEGPVEDAIERRIAAALDEPGNGPHGPMNRIGDEPSSNGDGHR
jgi:hypothetical protein